MEGFTLCAAPGKPFVVAWAVDTGVDVSGTLHKTLDLAKSVVGSLMKVLGRQQNIEDRQKLLLGFFTI